MGQSTPSRRNWNKIDPVEYFRESYEGEITTRTQLQKQDKGLYHILNKQGKLDQILPNTQENNRDWKKTDPVEYFKENYQGKITTRKQLSKQDSGLYKALRKQGKLDTILPEKRETRDWTTTDPLEYFNKHYKKTIKTRKQLAKQDEGLYKALRKQGKLDTILPNTNQKHRNWKKTNPEQYFKKHYEGKITTRHQLEKQDKGLYNALRKQGKLDQTLPNTQENNRDWKKTNPIQYFKKHYEGKITTRKQLQKKDNGLYDALRKQGKLDTILPEKRETRDWTTTDPIEYFNKHYKNTVTTRYQLEKKDPSLYGLLRKQRKLDIVFPPPNKKEILEKLLQNFNEGNSDLEDKINEDDTEGDQNEA